MVSRFMPWKLEFFDSSEVWETMLMVGLWIQNMPLGLVTRISSFIRDQSRFWWHFDTLDALKKGKIGGEAELWSGGQSRGWEGCRVAASSGGKQFVGVAVDLAEKKIWPPGNKAMKIWTMQEIWCFCRFKKCLFVYFSKIFFGDEKKHFFCEPGLESTECGTKPRPSATSQKRGMKQTWSRKNHDRKSRQISTEIWMY